MELVRELDGEEAYEKMCRAVERASQPPHSHVPSRCGPELGLWPQPLGLSQGCPGIAHSRTKPRSVQVW